MKRGGWVLFKRTNLFFGGLVVVVVLITSAVLADTLNLLPQQPEKVITPPTLFNPSDVAFLPSSAPSTDAPTALLPTTTPDPTSTNPASPTHIPSSPTPTVTASPPPTMSATNTSTAAPPPVPSPTSTPTGTPSATAIPTQQSTPVVVQVQQQAVPSQIMIQFEPGTTRQQRIQYIQSIGGKVTREINALDTLVVNVPSEVADRPLPESPVVATSEPDYYVTALDDPPAGPSNDPLYEQQWALPVIGAPEAWASLPADAPKITVAVIDSGVCADHPDLSGRILNGWDFLEQDAIPQDDFGHGCAVSGVIAANLNDGIGIAGVAPNAQIMPLRVLNAQGVGSYSDVAAAIVYATDNGAQIINLSLGGSSSSSTLESAINYADSHGVMVIAAAGNTGGSVLYPAAYEPVIAVASVDRDLQRSSFSSYGPEIDLLAPGRDILTTKRDGSYGLVSGTSFAAPHVAGVAAVEIALGKVLVIDGQIINFKTNQQPISPTFTATSTPSNEYLPSVTPFDTPHAPTSTPTPPVEMQWNEETIPYLGFTLSYPQTWNMQALPYVDFGFRISSPEIEVDAIGRPLAGGFISATFMNETLEEWNQFLETEQQSKKVTISSFSGIVTPGINSKYYNSTEWHVYAFDKHYTFWFVAYITNYDSLYPIVNQIVESVLFTGKYAAFPQPSLTISSLGVGSFPSLKHVFPIGPGKILNDQKASTHFGGDDYALDICGGNDCTESQLNDLILAPTDIKLVHSIKSWGMEDSLVNDFHFFEISSGDTDKLCMSLGHVKITVSGFVIGTRMPRGAHIGRILDYTPNGGTDHIHMGLFTVPLDKSCAAAADRQAIPFDNANGGFSLDGENFSPNTNHIGQTVQSSNAPFCAMPSATGVFPMADVESLGTPPVGCDGNDFTPPSGNFTSPNNGATVQTSVNLAGTASDTSGIQKVQFTAWWPGVDPGRWYIVTADTSSPYQYTWNLCQGISGFPNGIPNGQITLGIDITDNAGNTAYSPGGTRSITKNGDCSVPPPPPPPPPPSSAVKLYPQANYQGGIVYSQGTGYSNDPNKSYQSYSLEIPGGWSVKTWRGDNRGGEERCWSSSMSNLETHGWQNAIEAMEVFNYNACPPPPSTKVTLCANDSATTDCWEFPVGEYYGLSNIAPQDLNDHFRSIKVPSGMSAMLFREGGMKGTTECYRRGSETVTFGRNLGPGRTGIVT